MLVNYKNPQMTLRMQGHDTGMAFTQDVQDGLLRMALLNNDQDQDCTGDMAVKDVLADMMVDTVAVPNACLTPSPLLTNMVMLFLITLLRFLMMTPVTLNTIQSMMPASVLI